MTERALRPRRSFIFAPGTRPDMYPKALASGADIICIDLEDAIAPADKAEARAKTLALFENPPPDDGLERIVRINGLRTVDGLADLQAIVAGPKRPPAIMVPKVKSPEDLRALDDLLDSENVALALHVIIETNEGLEAASEIARASPRLEALFFGGVDMSAELRCPGTWPALSYARARVVHAAAQAGIDVIDVPFLDLDDLPAMRREAEAAAELGFTGKGAIHPKQIPILNEIFTPNAELIEKARQIVEAFDQADSGLVVFGGKLVEKPVLRSMHRILAVAERVAQRDS